MKSYKMIKASVAAALAAGVIGINAPLSTEAVAADFSLTILHTNDTHASLKEAPKRATLVKQLRAAAGNENSLLVDAGDVFSGSLYFNEFEGQADLAMMNYMGYDAMTFGNHEFDLGSSDEGHQALANFVQGADFPFVSANVDFSADAKFDGLQNFVYSEAAEDGQIYSGMIKEINGEKVGVFGLTTEETPSISSTGAIEFSSYIDAAEEAVAAFEAAGVNKVIALTHLGYNDSADFDNDILLSEVPGIDVIVGGHSHTELLAPVVRTNSTSGDPVVIVQAGATNKYLGELDVTFDAEGVVQTQAGTLHLVANAAADAEATELLQPFKDQVDLRSQESIGATAGVVLSATRNTVASVRSAETNLGNLITDGMLAGAKKVDPDTVIALQNGGGIRTSIGTGDITYGEVISVLPFGNSLAIMNLTGKEIKDALEISVKSYPAESGGFLQVSGLQFVFDPSRDVGKRVVSANVMNEDGTLDPLRDTQYYKVATNAFTAQGGDGYTVFATAYADGRVSEPGVADYQMFIDEARKAGTVRPFLEGRITTVLPFKDVTLLDWEYPYVNDLFARQVMTGTSTNTFSPDMVLPRWQVASMMVRLLNLPTNVPEDQKAPFTDIANLPVKHQNEIHALYAKGLISGTTETTFNPTGSIKRSHFALMMNNVFTTNYFQPKEHTTAPFSDVSKLPQLEQDAIWNMYTNGIISGYPNGTFKPAGTTTRAEAARIFSMFAPYLNLQPEAR